jgi:hypothetical protein
MFILFYISLPLVKEISHYGKTPVKTFPRAMNTCVQLASAINKRTHTLYGKEASQHSTHIHSFSSLYLDDDDDDDDYYYYCLTTGPKRALHIVRSRASSFK